MLKRKSIFIFISAMLTFTLILTGCNQNMEYSEDADTEYGDESLTEQTDTEQEYNDFEFDETEYTPLSDEILNLSFKGDDTKLSSFISFVKGIKVNYQYSQHYNIDECLKLYNSVKRENLPTGATEIVKNKKVDYNTLLPIVKKNTANIIKRDSYYSALPDATVEKIVKCVTTTINYNLPKNPYINLNVLDYNLKNLSVARADEPSGYAVYNQKDRTLCLIVDESELSESEFIETITHEANHLLQNSSTTLEDFVEYNVGICYKFKDVAINSLFWTWYVEGAAQIGSLTQNNIPTADSFVYCDNVYFINSLNNALALNSNDVYAITHVTSSNDLNDFLELFDCQTEEEKREILNLMVTINLYMDSYDTTISDGFFEKTKLLDDINIKKKLLNPIVNSMTKIFYKNLAEKLKDSTVKLKDVFSLISVFETQLSSVSRYNSEENIPFLGDFFKQYLNIQNQFFGTLAGQLNLTEQEIRTHFTNYHNTTDHSSFSNSMLNAEQNAFYKSTYKDRADIRGATVFEAKAKWDVISK